MEPSAHTETGKQVATCSCREHMRPGLPAMVIQGLASTLPPSSFQIGKMWGLPLLLVVLVLLAVVMVVTATSVLLSWSGAAAALPKALPSTPHARLRDPSGSSPTLAFSAATRTNERLATTPQHQRGRRRSTSWHSSSSSPGI